MTRRGLLIAGAAAGTGLVLSRVLDGDSETSGGGASHGPRVRPPTPRPSTSVDPRAINARDFGVREDVADISGPLNALIADHPGATIVLPGGATYSTKADNGRPSSGHGGGIVLGRPGTTLDLRGATIRMQASASTHYQIIDVDAPGCRVVGGTLVGDVGHHSGTAGEYGHGLSIGGGADRFLADGVVVRKCWGDGFFIWENAPDVELRSCVSDDNRRQGLSIIDATRPTVRGGWYVNTGRTAFISPGAGIDIEPDPNSSRDVLDARVIAVTVSGNAGPGVRVTSPGRTITASVVRVTATGNGTAVGDSELEVLGPRNTTRLVDCSSTRGTGSGFLVHSDATTVERCTSRGNAKSGFRVDHAAGVRFLDCQAVGNGHAGYVVGRGSEDIRLGDCTAEANGQAADDTYPQFDVYGTDTRLLRCDSAAGERPSKPSYGYVMRSESSGSLADCTAHGAFPGGAFLNQSRSVTAVPVPGSSS